MNCTIGECGTAMFILSVTTVFLLYLFATRHFQYWKKRGIPYLKPFPFIGNLREVVTFQKPFGVFLKDTYHSIKGQPYMGMFVYDQPVLIVRDLDILKDVFHKDFQHFVDKGLTVTKKDKLLGGALFCVKGDKWKAIRHQISPGFSSSKLKLMFNLVNNKAKLFDTYFDEVAETGTPIPARDVLGRLMTDIVASVGFGIECNSLQDPEAEFRKYLKYSFLYSKLGALKLVGAFVNLPLFHLFPITTVTNNAVHFFNEAVGRTVKHRENTNTVNSRSDYLDLLITIKNKEDAKEKTEKGSHIPLDFEIVSQAFTFLAAGFETTAAITLYSVYHLALDRDIQTHLRREIQDAVTNNDGQITYEIIQSLSYLDMVVSETLRLYPTMPFIDRTCTKPYKLPGTDVVIDKGVFLFTSLLGIQRDPDLYPDPDRFDPERFSDANKKNRHKCAYMPFGEGPRICVGKRFGVMVVKNILSRLLLNYEILPCPETPKQLQFDVRTFLLSINHEIPLIFKRVA